MSRHPLFERSESTEALAEESLRDYAEARAARSRTAREALLAGPSAGNGDIPPAAPIEPPAEGHFASEPDSVPATPDVSGAVTPELFSHFPELHVTPPVRAVFCSDPRSSSADRFRLLRMRLRDSRTAKNVKSIVITSPLPNDGKTTIAMNLATALTERQQQTVLLIDADMHRSPLSRLLDRDIRPGLAECLADDVDPLAAIKRVEPMGWHYLSAGTPQKTRRNYFKNRRLSN